MGEVLLPGRMALGEGPRGARAHGTGWEMKGTAQKREKCREKSSKEGKPGSSFVRDSDSV